MSSQQRYLRKADDPFVFAYTDLLAQRGDMFECDLKGNRIYNEQQKPDDTPAIIIPPPDVHSAADDSTENSYESLSRDQLMAIATGLGLRIHPSAKTETIIKKIRDINGA